MPFGETIAAPATPPGESALAVVRASGPLVPKLAAEILGRADGEAPPPRQAMLGGYRALGGEVLDQIVLTYFAAPASYTGEDLLEISCHGNALLVRRILDDLLARGCRPAAPGEFTRTAYLNGKLDLAQAEAVADMIHARSEGALRAARRQLDGELSRRVADFSAILLQVQAELEAFIDFPEEDLPAEDSDGARLRLTLLAGELEGLLATSRYGDLLREGASAVIIGPPNAGKSSLLNALLGRPRAIVSPEPGTTRDFIEERFLVGPYSIQIIDTAGLRADATNAIEQEGIARTHEKMATADVLLVVIDSTISPPTLDSKWLQSASAATTLVIENKTDLSDSIDRQGFLQNCTHIRLSLKTEKGLDQLCFELVRILEQRYAVRSEGLVLTSARHTDALRRARTGVLAAMEKLDGPQSTELLASDLRQALEALGEIPGVHSVDGSISHAYESMLDQLFAKFCIGK